jgi:uncharacterized DUF497 family protein
MYEWDQRNIRHIARHRVTPAEAEEALQDPRRTPAEAYDLRGERRDGATGMTTAGRMLTVVYTPRGFRRVRVIMARPASADERRKYRR